MRYPSIWVVVSFSSISSSHLLFSSSTSCSILGSNESVCSHLDSNVNEVKLHFLFVPCLWFWSIWKDRTTDLEEDHFVFNNLYCFSWYLRTFAHLSAKKLISCPMLILAFWDIFSSLITAQISSSVQLKWYSLKTFWLLHPTSASMSITDCLNEDCLETICEPSEFRPIVWMCENIWLQTHSGRKQCFGGHLGIYWVRMVQNR